MASETISLDTEALENLRDKYFSCYDRMTKVVTNLNTASSALQTLEGLEFKTLNTRFNNMYKHSDELLESITNIREYINVVIENSKATERQIESVLEKAFAGLNKVNTEIDRKW